eukprot:7452512-Pyramimonas_sp.AAC.1
MPPWGALRRSAGEEQRRPGGPPMSRTANKHRIHEHSAYGSCTVHNEGIRHVIGTLNGTVVGLAKEA